MNPFLAKLIAILVEKKVGHGLEWKDTNETVVVFGWNGNTMLLAREKGELEIHPTLQIKLRLPNNTDILPPGLVQQMARKM